MERQKKFRWGWYLSLISATVIGGFWLVWHLFSGQIPHSTIDFIIKEGDLQKTLIIPRYWDMLIGPIWSWIIVLIVTSERFQRVGEIKKAMIGGLVFIAGALIIEAVAGELFILSSLLLGLVLCFAVGDLIGRKNLIAALIFSTLLIGLEANLRCGVIYSVFILPSVGLAIFLFFTLVRLHFFNPLLRDK